MTSQNAISTCLWFEKDGLSAARFYVDLIPESQLLTKVGDGPEPFGISFTLGGAPYQIINGGPHFKLSPACSIAVATPDQAETDRIWEALTADGGQESRCGWLADRWGVSWQVYPKALGTMLGAADREAAGRAQAAMMTMAKIDIAVMQAAFDGK